MSIFRRRLMMGQGKTEILPANSYIQDGLVFQLDGYERGTTVNNEWVDLIGGQVFVSSGQSTDAVWRRGKLITPHEMRCADYALDVTLGNMTLEAVFSLTTTANGTILKVKATSDRSADSAGLAVYAGYFILSNKRGARPSVSGVSNGMCTLSATALSDVSGRAIINGIARTVLKYDFIYANNNYAQIGSITGSISSIRIYNRVLTVEEQLYNQRIDNERFNLGLTL